MNQLRYYSLLLLMLLPVTLVTSVVPADAASYTAGVTAGQWASLAPVKVTYSGTGAYSAEPQQIKDLNATVLTTAIVQQVLSTNIILQSVTLYQNSTSQTATRYGDLSTGIGNLTFGLIAGGLSAGDRLWVGTYTPSINQTMSMTYLAMSRSVNIYNTTYRVPLGPDFETVGMEFVWDQSSGIVLESKNLTVYPSLTTGSGFVEYSDVRIQSTNVFSNPKSPDFTITASPSSANTNSSAVSTITVEAVKGFADTVLLTDSVPSGLTCDPISPSTIAGHGTASLSCKSTAPGTYNVTITATSGPTSHTATTKVTITAAPSNTSSAPASILGLAPIVFFAIIGAVVIVIAALGGFLLLRAKSERYETQSTATTE